jgi:hypothetical protein
MLSEFLSLIDALENWMVLAIIVVFFGGLGGIATMLANAAEPSMPWEDE